MPNGWRRVWQIARGAVGKVRFGCCFWNSATAASSTSSSGSPSCVYWSEGGRVREAGNEGERAGTHMYLDVIRKTYVAA